MLSRHLNTYKPSRYMRNISSWRTHVLEKERRKIERENVDKIANQIKEVKTELFVVCLFMAWSSVGICYCIRNNR